MSFAGVDRRGDVSFTMTAGGVVSDAVVRDPFGKTLGFTGCTPDVGFQSDWTDPTSGLVWMGARWYQPGTGTFVSRDTVAGGVGAYASMNRFTYGLNNPVLFNDPTGRVAAPAGCDNACHFEYLQRTGNLYDDPKDSFNDHFQNGDRDATTNIYNDADGNPVIVVQNDVGITISTSNVTYREDNPVSVVSTSNDTYRADKPGSSGTDTCDPSDFTTFDIDQEDCTPGSGIDGTFTFGTKRKRAPDLTKEVDKHQPMNASRNYYDVSLGDYKTVNDVAQTINIDPILLLIVYLKERAGWQKNQDSTVRDLGDTLKPGGDFGSSMGVTNLQFAMFKEIYDKHTSVLNQFGMKAGMTDDELQKRWRDLENPDSGGKDVRLSLAMTALLLGDRMDLYATMPGLKDFGMKNEITRSEWAAISYRLGEDTTTKVATGAPNYPLGPLSEEELLHFRIQYKTLSAKYK
jgi:RHS repeat-associated protein